MPYETLYLLHGLSSMATANVARRNGDDFQARLFWLKAASLLDPASPVISVAYETGPKGFDDIRVQFDPQKPKRDHRGEPIYQEHIQCKWHTTAGSFGYTDLIDPSFINASRFSILQRAHRAQTEHAADGIGCQFKLLTNWRLTAADPLQDLVRKESDSIDLEKLFEGATDNSRMGKVRKLWRDHLAIDHAGLTLVARVLAIAETSDSLAHLRERLDEKFAYVGMKRIPPHESAFVYDDLIIKLLAQGRIHFDRKTFHEIMERERLLESQPVLNMPPTIGIRSFMHPIDSLEERCVSILDLVPYFEGRYIREDSHWQKTLFPKLQSFLISNARQNDHLRIIIDAHVSISFSVGAVLNVKSGKRIEIEQRATGRFFWSIDDTPIDPSWPKLTFDEETVAGQDGAIAIAISLTHDVSPAVRAYIAQNQLPITKILHCRPENGFSQRSVQNGRHAGMLAESIVQKLLPIPSRAGNRRHTHIFMAGPNSFAFFLGQHQNAVGPVSIYEWDFDGQRGGGYSLGLSI